MNGSGSQPHPDSTDQHVACGVESTERGTRVTSVRVGLAAHTASGVKIELDYVRQEVTIGTVTAELTRAELAVFQYLADQPNHWHAHSTMRTALFGSSSVGDSSLVRVHLHNIRKKLGTAAHWLRTERYHGTMLDLDASSVRHAG